MTHSPFIAQIFARPDAPSVVAALVRQMEEERSKRTDFYHWLDEQTKAEFINGEIVIHSPVSFEHNRVCVRLLLLLERFVAKHRLGHVGFEKLLIALERNDYEPDLCFFAQEKAAQFAPDQKLFPAPDLVVEVASKSTRARDRGVKFQDYAHSGVQEYWIVEPRLRRIEQYVLGSASGTYGIKPFDQEGRLVSTAIAGLCFDPEAAFDDGALNAFLEKLYS